MFRPADNQCCSLAQYVVAVLLVIIACNAVIFAQQVDQFEHAKSLFEEGRYAEASRALAALTVSDPAKVEAHLYLGKALINTNRFGEAEAALQRYTTAIPTSHDGYYLLGYALFRQGRAKQSLKVYEHAAGIRLPTSDDLKIIGLNYALLEDYKQSALYLEKALVANPQNTEALYYLGRARYTLNLFTEALQAFEEVLRRDPLHVKAQNNIGQVLEAQNNADGAIAVYRRAIELDRNSAKPNEWPLLNLGALLLERNNVEEALSLLVRAAAINPKAAKIRFQLGKAYLRLGHLQDAEKELIEATRLDPKDVGARYQLGRLYHRLGKRELARRELEISEQLRTRRQ